METIITLYDRKGVAIESLDQPNVVRTWELNKIGKAEFIVPRGNAKLRKEVFQYGNLVYIEHDRAGAWGGRLWSDSKGHEWVQEGLKVTAYAYESILQYRRSTLQVAGASRDAVFEALVAEANGLVDSRLSVGSTSSGGNSFSADYRFRLTYDIINEWTRLGYVDWSLDPVFDNGRLLFEANLWPFGKKGRQHDVALTEGVNVKWSDSAAMTEQGAIVNDLELVGNAARRGSKPFVDRRDDTTINQYGLAQAVMTTQSTAPSLDQAQAIINNYKHPRSTFKIVAIDVDMGTGLAKTFDYLGLGDTLWLDMPSVGFEGTHTRIRILGKAFDDATGEMELTVDEVKA